VNFSFSHTQLLSVLLGILVSLNAQHTFHFSHSKPTFGEVVTEYINRGVETHIVVKNVRILVVVVVKAAKSILVIVFVVVIMTKINLI